MDLALSLSGVEDLYAAVAALEAELIASRGPPVDKIRAGSLASCYLSVLLFQAVRETIRTKGVPRALCVTAGNEGVYPYFDAPVIGSAECIERGLVAELMVDAVAVAEDATVPMASLADLVPVTSDGAAIGAGLSADDESFGYHRLLGMTGRRSEKKPVLELAEAVIKATGSKSTVVYRPLPKDDPKKRCPDITRARDWLGWEPQVTLAAGLQQTIDWYKGQIATKIPG